MDLMDGSDGCAECTFRALVNIMISVLYVVYVKGDYFVFRVVKNNTKISNLQ